MAADHKQAKRFGFQAALSAKEEIENPKSVFARIEGESVKNRLQCILINVDNCKNKAVANFYNFFIQFLVYEHDSKITDFEKIERDRLRVVYNEKYLKTEDPGITKLISISEYKVDSVEPGIMGWWNL